MLSLPTAQFDASLILSLALSQSLCMSLTPTTPDRSIENHRKIHLHPPDPGPDPHPVRPGRGRDLGPGSCALRPGPVPSALDWHLTRSFCYSWVHYHVKQEWISNWVGQIPMKDIHDTPCVCCISYVHRIERVGWEEYYLWAENSPVWREICPSPRQPFSFPRWWPPGYIVTG